MSQKTVKVTSEASFWLQRLLGLEAAAKRHARRHVIPTDEYYNTLCDYGLALKKAGNTDKQVWDAVCAASFCPGTAAVAGGVALGR